MTVPEFSRPIRIDTLGEGSRALSIEADEGERFALAKRFGLLEINRLTADLTLTLAGADILMRGSLSAEVTQACVASGELVPATVEAPFEIIFRPLPGSAGPDAEVELSESELDVAFLDGAAVDVGEAVAETLALSLDPYPRAPGAEEKLKAAGVLGEEEAGPFSALAGLKDKLKKG